MKRHSSICQRSEPSHEKTCSTWYWLQHDEELRQNMKVICIDTKNVGLLPWVVCESGMTCYVDGGSSTGDHSSSVSAQDVGGSQVIDGKDVISSAMSDDWTLYIDDFSVTRSPFSSSQFYCSRSRMLSLQLLQLERFRHLSTIFLSCNLIVKDSSSLHQSWWTLLHLNFSLSSVFCVVIDSIIAWTPTYCITLWLSTLFSRLGYCITLWLTTFLAD